jgi:integrase
LGNPLDGVTQPKSPRRERLLTAHEVGALLTELDRSAAQGAESHQFVAAIHTAVLTGCRISEVLNLRWADVRRDELELHLLDTKTGFSRRPISAEALAVIESNRRVVGVPFVFRAVTNPSKPLFYNTVEKAFRRICQRAGIEDCSLHTIRHWFATVAANSISNPRVGMALTGHRSHAAYMNYVHSDRQQAAPACRSDRRVCRQPHGQGQCCAIAPKNA